MSAFHRREPLLPITDIAAICHDANRRLCMRLGDFSQPEWEVAPDWQRDSAISGVEAILNCQVLQPEQSHENWMRDKERDGWVYGEVKDAEAKTHPCLVPFDKLSRDQQVKDLLFFAIVTGLSLEAGIGTIGIGLPFNINKEPEIGLRHVEGEGEFPMPGPQAPGDPQADGDDSPASHVGAPWPADMRARGNGGPGEGAGSGPAPAFTDLLVRQINGIRKDMKDVAALTEVLRTDIIDGHFAQRPGEGRGEVIANITLAYRHLEDASMRLGKAIQARDGGVSVYDKATTVGAP